MVKNTDEYHGSLGGNKFRLNEAENPYQKGIRRSEGVPYRDVSNNRGQFNTRPDIRSIFQTTWARGSFWNKPLLSDTSMDTYFTSRGLDMVTEPGNVYALPDFQTLSTSNRINNRGLGLQVARDEIYYFETGGGNVGLLLYDGSSVSTLTNDFGVSGQGPVNMCWDAANSRIYALFANGEVGYITPDSAGGSIIDVGDVYNGANIFMHFGRLLVYTGDILVEVEDPLGSPAVTTIYDDGMGPDVSEEIHIGAPGPDYPIRTDDIKLGVSSNEGIWIVKNVNQDGVVQAFLTRVDRTNDGTDVGIPMTTLPRNVMAIDLTYHLGGVVISGAANMNRVYGNDISVYGYPKIVLYSLIGNNVTAIGSPLGGINPDEAPYKFLAADENKLYIGGNKGIWVYEAIRGGLHKLVHTDDYDTQGGTFNSMAFTTDASGNEVLQLTKYAGDQLLFQQPMHDEGGGSDDHYLESNYFDFNIPAEQKTITHVTLMTDGVSAGEEWQLWIETDDGSFVQVITHDEDQANTEKQRITPVTGYRFRYKLVWVGDSDVATPSRCKGVVLHALQGEMVTQWGLAVDAKSFRNVEGAPIQSDDVIAWLETVAADQTVLEFIDDYKATSTTHNVKVESVTVSKPSPNEGQAMVVLTEDT